MFAEIIILKTLYNLDIEITMGKCFQVTISFQTVYLFEISVIILYRQLCKINIQVCQFYTQICHKKQTILSV